MDFLAPRGVNRFSCAAGAAFKDKWQPNFCLASQAQLGELVFTLNRQAGLTLKMNIQSLGREWRAEGERQSHQQWQTRAGSRQHLEGDKPLHSSSRVSPQENQPSSSRRGVPQWASLWYLGFAQ